MGYFFLIIIFVSSFNNKCSSIGKDEEITCSRNSTSQNDDVNASQKYLSISSNASENIREMPKNTYFSLNDEYQQNAQGIRYLFTIFENNIYY